MMDGEFPNEVEAYELSCINDDQLAQQELERERLYYQIYESMNLLYGLDMEFNDFCQWLDLTQSSAERDKER